ncbi:hypothetical protein NEOLEDRAFT_635186 [Neolentinus lepideus HHB14362 ss-1]|uniref:F-box domain-containing protein n=1 Tax=Neolentinus lepideus HHB14362 ss-1 TaxID=1314782 RepID=A0A165QN12_9AGAM|nr:hypothetical protein NEOLEDRAFT_635186 [Neolentinus lepideus HHB14362 ss-1]
MVKRTRQYGTSSIRIDGDQRPLKRSRKGRNVGKLTMLLAMPMDILFEIFAHLHPLDLLHVARTSKGLRRILLAPSSTSVWKDSLSADADLPECPLDLSYPGWAHLVYDPFCHRCSVARVKNPDWKLRVRLCTPCSKRELHVYFPWSFGAVPIPDLLPHRDIKETRSIYVRTHMINMTSRWKAFKQDQDARVNFFTERRNIVRQIDEHASKCEAWARKKALDRIEYQDTLRLARRAAIIQKLRDAGYSAELETMTADDWTSFDRLKPVAQKRALTDRESIIQFIMSRKRKQPQHVS